VTVIRFAKRAEVAVDVRGGAAGTMMTDRDAARLRERMDRCHGAVGRFCYGLEAVAGVATAR
jgi:hypothetical protein